MAIYRPSEQGPMIKLLAKGLTEIVTTKSGFLVEKIVTSAKRNFFGGAYPTDMTKEEIRTMDTVHRIRNACGKNPYGKTKHFKTLYELEEAQVFQEEGTFLGCYTVWDRENLIFCNDTTPKIGKD